MSEIKLPESHIDAYVNEDFEWIHVTGYTADQMKAAILEERERWQKDAQRYRWLRDRAPWTMVSANGMIRIAARLPVDYKPSDVETAHEMDEAIDAAIRSK